MGKVKKNKINCNRNDPLDQQTSENYDPKSSPRNKIKNTLLKDDETVDSEFTSITVKKEESHKTEDSNEGSEFPEVNANWSNTHKIQNNMRNGLSSLDDQSPMDSSEVSQSEREDEDVDAKAEEGGDEEGEEDKKFSIFNNSIWDATDIKINERDERAFARFMGADVEHRATLADFIKRKLSEETTEFYVFADIDNKVSKRLENNMFPYKELAPVLEDYTHGRFPDRFKNIPDCLNWEQILYITKPDKWTTAAVLEATCIFSTNKDPVVVQRFFNTILCLRMRDAIADSKTLDTPLYQALRIALDNPAAFFKGIILPLCKAKNCTLREATILSYIIAKGDISHIHCSAALLTIAEMEYSLANSIFMKVLLDKMFPLTPRIQNAIVAHFRRFMADTTKYPLLWYQCLLTFVQIYKDKLSAEQTKILLQLLTVQLHHPLIEKIIRELQPFLS